MGHGGRGREMSDHYVMNEAGYVVEHHGSLVEWSQKVGEQKRIAHTQIGDVSVSTIFLGMDHSFGDGQGLFFETMVFGGPLDEDMDRYATREMAIKGHAAMVKRVTDPEGDQ